MGILLFVLVFIGLLVGVYYLAKLIINYVPRKIHWVISLLLLGISLLLGYLIYSGIIGDINFHAEKKIRYTKVIDQLKIIRKAENDYLKAKGTYTASFDKLVNFIEKDSFALTRTYEKEITIIERGIPVKKSVKQVDTTGYSPVIAEYKNIAYKTMMNVSGTSTKFDLKTGTVKKGITDRKVSVFEAKVLKETVLDGMESMKKKLLRQELSVVSMDEVKGKYISVGSLEQVKDGGNWPLEYDTENEDNK